MNDLCVLDHGDSERRALPGLRLCGSDRDRLGYNLQALPRLWADLGDNLATVSSSGQRVSGSPSQPLPINPAVAEHRDQIKHDLVWWCVFVADNREITVPANNVAAIAAWLGKHVEWIAGHEVAAEECPPAIRELAGRARALLDPSGARRVTVGPCLLSYDGQPCGGTLHAIFRQEGDPRPCAILCGECDFEIPPEQWLRFGREYLRQTAS